MIFPNCFSLSLNLAIRSSQSEIQSVPGLVCADFIEILHSCKEYNQSDFSIDHLVMSMCRVFSCVVRRGLGLGLYPAIGMYIGILTLPFKIKYLWVPYLLTHGHTLF